MTTNIRLQNIKQSEAIKQYAIEKIESLEKYFDNITQADITVGMITTGQNKGKIFTCEVNLHIPKKVIHISKEAEDLYKAIDKVKDHLKVELEKVKGRMRNSDKAVLRAQKEYSLDD